MSKAVFSLQRSVRFQRALLFAIINPQVNSPSLDVDVMYASFLVSHNPESVTLICYSFYAYVQTRENQFLFPSSTSIFDFPGGRY